MTQLRRNASSISNYFDSLFDGVGHRGSSFSDCDWIAHDGRTQRFLVMEFKGPQEPNISLGQRRMLGGLALIPRFTVWALRVLDGGMIRFLCVPRGVKDRWSDHIEEITGDECRERYAAWWDNRTSARVVVPRVDTSMQDLLAQWEREGLPFD